MLYHLLNKIEILYTVQHYVPVSMPLFSGKANSQYSTNVPNYNSHICAPPPKFSDFQKSLLMHIRSYDII